MHSSALDQIIPAANQPPSDRRRRTHLRELCDEVLASFRVAHGRDLISEQDRMDGKSLISRIVSQKR
jgi:hypothetical protein